MTRDDLYGHYRRYYVPNNATLVIVGDVDTDEVLRRVEHHFGTIPGRRVARRRASAEPPQQAERRVHFRKEGTTAYWRAAFHAPAFGDADFFPMLFVDAALSGASGLNIWSGGHVPTPQRSARLYRALVDTGLASAVGGAVLPTEHPFLYYLWATVAEGKTLAGGGGGGPRRARSDRRDGITEAELAKVRAPAARALRLRRDSVTDIAHQLGYFETIGSWQDALTLVARLAAVTLDQVNAAARDVSSIRQPDHRVVRAHGGRMPLTPVRQTLPNGMIVLAKETHTTPAVIAGRGDACRRLRRSREPRGDRGAAWRACSIAARQRRTADRDRRRARRPRRLALRVRRPASDHGQRHVPGRGLRAGLAHRRRHRSRSRSFADREVDTRRAELLTTILQDEDDPAAVAVERLMPRLYRASSLRPQGARHRATVEAHHARRSRAFPPQRFTPEQPRRGRRRRACRGGGGARGGRGARLVDCRAWRQPARHVPAAAGGHRDAGGGVPMMNKAQADVAYGFIGIRRTDPDYYAAWVMNNALGQYALGGRLGDSIRERQGMAYYVYSTLDAGLAEGPLMIRAGVSAANVERTIASIDRELDAGARRRASRRRSSTSRSAI